MSTGQGHSHSGRLTEADIGEPFLSPEKIGTDGANTFPSAMRTSVDDGLLHPDPVHYVTKHLQQGIGSDQSFKTARQFRVISVIDFATDEKFHHCTTTYSLQLVS